MKKLIALMLTSFILGGCATTAVPLNVAKPVPSDRIAYINPQNTDGKLVVVRDVGMLGGACYLGFFIDGKYAATFDTGERATFNISSGEHIVGIGNSQLTNGLCAIGMLSLREVSTIVKPGDMKFFRLVVRPGDGVTIEPSTQLTE